jgi:hypothetical protein
MQPELKALLRDLRASMSDNERRAAVAYIERLKPCSISRAQCPIPSRPFALRRGRARRPGHRRRAAAGGSSSGDSDLGDPEPDGDNPRAGWLRTAGGGS